MQLFLGRHENKVDAKGRVSVPAPFRAALAKEEYDGVVLFKAPAAPAIEAISMERMKLYVESVDHLDMFTPKQNKLAAKIFERSEMPKFDSHGRILLPGWMMEFSKITNRALFVGRGNGFRIWEPSAYAEEEAKLQDDEDLEELSFRLIKPPPMGADS